MITIRRGLLILVAVVLACSSFQGASQRTVIRVIDGDTVVLDGDERVRLIGVNTPEVHHPRKPVEFFGAEATEFVRDLVEGQRVRLEGDPETASKDHYGRTLAYVWLVDGRLLNLEIVRQGYGFALTKYPFTRAEEFRAAERDAREARMGLWAGE